MYRESMTHHKSTLSPIKGPNNVNRFAIDGMVLLGSEIVIEKE